LPGARRHQRVLMKVGPGPRRQPRWSTIQS